MYIMSSYIVTRIYLEKTKIPFNNLELKEWYLRNDFDR